MLKRFTLRCCLPAMLAIVVCWPAPAAAQDNVPAKKTEKKAAKDEDEIPPPEEIVRTTDDGVKLGITYYPGTKGKESVPVILVHGLKGSRKDYLKPGLAAYLQETLGCAVVVPDLRGHGDSTTIAAGVNKRGEKITRKISASGTMPPTQYALMVTQDMRAVKDFLWEKNNAGELNIDKTCVVGADMGAAIALNYALYDSVGYEHKDSVRFDADGTPMYGPLKLGRFVKALVLISPERATKGITTKGALSSPVVRNGKCIATMILVGTDNSKALADATFINDLFKDTHRLPGELTKPDEIKRARTLWFGKFDTSLEGTKLLGDEAKDLHVRDHIRTFITLRLIDNPDMKAATWKERKLPHQ